MTNIRQILPHNMQRKRKEAELTQMQLAERIHVSLSYVAQIEQGKKLPTLKTLEAMCHAMGTSMDVLMCAPETLKAGDKELSESVKKLKLHDRKLVLDISRLLLKK